MRGGGLRRVELDEGVAISEERWEELLSLDEALNQLMELNRRQGTGGGASLTSAACPWNFKQLLVNPES
jgi:hypothetical protein